MDRLKELIKCKGFQVAPAEIENVLHGHPDILDAAVIREPHPAFGEAPVAYVVVREGSGLSEEAIIKYAAYGMAKYKQLAKVLLIDAIPRSPSGKILRRVLKGYSQEDRGRINRVWCMAWPGDKRALSR